MVRAEKQGKRGFFGRALLGAPAWPSPKGCPGGARPSRCPKQGNVMPPRLRGRYREERHLLPGGHPSQTLARAIIHKHIDASQLLLADPGERRFLRMESSDQPIGVFIGSPFPRVVGVGKKHIHGQGLRHLFVASEFFTIIESSRLTSLGRQGSEQPADLIRDFPCLLASRIADQCETRGSLNQGHQVTRRGRPIDQINFPMPHVLSGLHRRWPGVDRALVRNLASASPLLARAPTVTLAFGAGKMLPQGSAPFGVGVDVLVNRLLRDPSTPLRASSVANDIRRPPLPDPSLGIESHLLSKAPWSGALGAGRRRCLRLFRPVVGKPRITLDLAGNGSGRSTQPPSRLLDTNPCLLPLINQRTFPCGHAFVSHSVLLVLSHMKNVACRVTFSYHKCCNSRWRAGLQKNGMRRRGPCRKMYSDRNTWRSLWRTVLACSGMWMPVQ